MENKGLTISIIGGTDGLGKWFARYLKNKGFNIIVTGRDIEKGKNVEKIIKKAIEQAISELENLRENIPAIE